VKQVLLVTGSSGIAAAPARLWSTENSGFIVGISAAECKNLATEFHEADCASTDVRHEFALQKAVSGCLDRFGRIDALFNVAGISARSAGDGPLHECKVEAWGLVMDVNAKGTFLMCREALKVRTRNAQGGVNLNCGACWLNGRNATISQRLGTRPVKERSRR